ncbi:EamA-like transporter family, putative [Trypanosoma equiperdum]|uniref:EamA-like transporter family, putative n=1 Tax=Trypanosoma equiperdum TaxID=5694 RepID=A0A1G4IH13_TRYEQ|nr:EamA-like transporter family, putative [Trypanosoma equiperdum]
MTSLDTPAKIDGQRDHGPDHTGPVGTDVREHVNDDQRKGCQCTIGSYALGVVMIICVAVIWTYASVLIQYIFSSQEYDKPFFMTYFNTNAFTVNNFGFLILSSWRRLPWRNEERSSPLVIYDDSLKETFTPNDGPVEGSDIEGKVIHSKQNRKTDVGRQQPYSKFRLLKCAAYFCPIWFLANSSFNLAISKTSVASVTVLSTTSGVWTFIISLIFFEQGFTWPCVLAIACTVTGALMVGLSDLKNTENDTISGDFCALMSAICYAVYTSVIKWQVPDDDRYSILMLFGFVGALNTLLFWPFVVIWHYTGFEPFSLPNFTQFGLLAANALVGTNLSEVLWARAVLLTSPVVATLGLTLTTPLAMTSDIFIKKKSFSALYIVGAVFLTMGFVLINLDWKLIKLCSQLSGRNDKRNTQRR